MDEAPARLRAQQAALTRHLRDPSRPAPTGWDNTRLGVYRDLLFNTIEGLLAGNFPVIRALLGDAAWRTTVRDFYRDHVCKTPLFPEIAREFLRWLDTLDDGALARPFLRELAHYEWVELALQIADVDDVAFDAIEDGAEGVRALLDGVPVPSPLAWPLAYTWPVHRIDASHQPDTPRPAPTLLLVRRDADGTVRFSELTPFAYRLLERIAEMPTLTGREQLEALASEAKHADADAFVVAASPLLAQLHGTGVLLGVAPVDLRAFVQNEAHAAPSPSGRGLG